MQVTEPSIRVEKDGHYPQIWSMEKLENRLVDMRELYEDVGPAALDSSNPFNKDPPAAFFEPDQPHMLLGIANVFLQVHHHLYFLLHMNTVGGTSN